MILKFPVKIKKSQLIEYPAACCDWDFLFKLHDYTKDDTLKKSIMAKGVNLNFELSKLVTPFGKTKLVRMLMDRFGISIASAERLVYSKKEWVPLSYIDYLLKVTNHHGLKEQIQNEIEYLKANHPPQRVYKAVKFLSPKLCNIVGAHTADGTLAHDGLIRITDYYEKNIEVLKDWIDSVFGINVKKYKIKNSSQEWGIELKSKVLGRYLNKIFDFPYGCKQYITREPNIIKNSSLEYRKAYALGAMTFEAGIGITHQVSLCVVSENFRDDISEILSMSGIKHTSKKEPCSCYWRLWSNLLSKEQAKEWMSFFAEGTDKWLLLSNYVNGFQRKVDSFEEAVNILDKVYPTKSANKVCLKDIIELIKEHQEVHRYQLAELICSKKKISSYGGTWAHSLKHYLDILKRANIISVENRRFGKKKSWGSIIREVYIFNKDITSWRLPQ